MVSPLDHGSLGGIEEDLEFHESLLRSLEDTQPEEVVESENLQQSIRRLQDRFAMLDGLEPEDFTSPPSSLTHSSVSVPSLSQFDGVPGEDTLSPDGPPMRHGSRNSISSAVSSNSSFPLPESLLYQDLSLPNRHRKRQYQNTDFSANVEPPPKRVTSNTARPPSSSSYTGSLDLRENLEGLSRLGDGAEELHRLLGFNTEDGLLEEMQREQMEAERWIEERKEQERQDAEFARILQDGWNDASGSTTASSSPGPVYPTMDPTVMPPPPGAGLDRMPRPFVLPSVNPLLADSSRSMFIPSVWERSNRVLPQRQQHPTSAQYLDSSDSDVIEITRGDFRRSAPCPFTEPLTKPRENGSLTTPSDYSWPSNLEEAFNLSNNLSGSFMETLHGQTRAPGASSDNWLLSDLMRNTVDEDSLKGKPLYGGLSHSSSVPGHSCGGLLPQSSRALGASSSSNCNSALDPSQDYYDLLTTTDTKKRTEEIKELLENIRPDTELSKESREGTPSAMKYPLMEHQKLGLAWMKSMEEGNNKGGILADDMGLGKTIQALALIVSRPSSESDRKTTLIIAPVALMQQWKREIERMLRSGVHQLSVYVLHGEKRSATFKDLRRYDVVLTTFGTLASELKRKEEWEGLQRRTNYSEDLNSRSFYLPVLGPKSTWYRVIIDEAQCIKNRNTKAALACCGINSTYRWCMSGTPMMNSVTELHSLLKFLRIRPYCELEKFNAEFTRPLKSASSSGQEKAMQQLQVLLKAVLLRRTKSSKIDGKPILQLPPRITEEVHAVFSEDEQDLYNALESKTQLQFNKYLRTGTIGRNYSNILVLLLRLRQACCHPHLMSDFSVDITASTGEIDLVANAKQFGHEVVIRLKENEPLECPVCIDAVENPIIFFPCGHSTCAECFARISDPALAVQQGHDGTVEVKCPNCRAKVDPKKVTDNISFKKVHFPDETRQAADEELNGVVDNESTDGNDDADSDADSLADFIVGDEDASEPSMAKKSKKGKGKGKGKAPQKQRKSLAQLKKEGQKNSKAKRKYLNRLQKTWVSSAKVEKTMELLEKIHDDAEGGKTIIFSQFTSLLDLLEVPIIRKGWDYRRYDGSMRPVDRNNSVADFTDNPSCTIMLVSLKAGNSGLNLVAASHVIIFDPFWNPYIEEQAIDRAHRIGQMRSVHVHRILVKKTVEDRILALQEKKRELIEGALDEKAGKNVSRLGTRELAYLFNIPQ